MWYEVVMGGEGISTWYVAEVSHLSWKVLPNWLVLMASWSPKV